VSFPKLSKGVERALELCGRDRVFHNDGSPASVAVRWEDPPQPRTGGWIVGRAEGTAEGHDAAGRKAAIEFAKRLRTEGARLIDWANSIDRALDGDTRG